MVILVCHVLNFSLTLFILMDDPKHIDTISMELSIVYFKGLLGQNFYKMMYFCP